MQALISLLDSNHRRQLEKLWDRLKEDFGADSKYTQFLPHFSYQVAESYSRPELEEQIREFAASHLPYHIQTAGIGMFTSPRTILFLPVIRNTELTLFHHKLWQKVSSLGNGRRELYHPDRWMPHITLAFGDIPSEKLSVMLRFLSEQTLDWDITVESISLIDDTILDDQTEFTIPLGADR